MSPEQCNGSAVDQRTDVYALGVILYEMVAGRLPFQATTLGDLLVAHLTEPPPPPSRFEPSIAPLVERAILQALEKDPAQRFSSIDALVKAFADVQTGGHPVFSTTPPPGTSTPMMPSTPTREARTPELDALVDKLHDGRNCKERRGPALAIIATNDTRYLDALRSARERRSSNGGFGGISFGTSEANACMRRELDAAIRHLEAQ